MIRWHCQIEKPADLEQKCFQNRIYPGTPGQGLTFFCFELTGVADAVRCYHCGGGLRNWEPGDNPWREHAKWYKDCPHILLVKGQSFVDNVLNGGPIDQDCSQHTKEVNLGVHINCFLFVVTDLN